MKSICILGHQIQPPIHFEVNRPKGQNRPNGQFGWNFLKSSIFIQLTWNLKTICISGHRIQPTINFEVNIGQKVNIDQSGQHRPKGQFGPNFQKSSIFIRLTWNLNRICISGQWIQPLITFEVILGQKENIGHKVNCF